MARAHLHTLRPLATAGQPPLNRQLRRFLARELADLRPTMARSVAQHRANRYRKHFDSYAHLCLLLFHGLSGSPSLRHSYAAFPTCPGLVALSGLGTTDPDRLAISFSQLAASTTSRPAGILADLVPALCARVRQGGVRQAGGPPADLRILDMTFLRLSYQIAPWLPVQEGPPGSGVRTQLLYTPALDLPEGVLITDTRRNDVQGLDALILDDPERLASLREHTLAVDLGYYSHARFARLRQAGVHFVTRRHAQATLTVTAQRPIQPALPGWPAEVADRIVVSQDAEITLGSPNNRAGTVLEGLRLVVATVAPRARAARGGATPVIYEVLTDRFDLTAAEVVLCYLWRWQIELFFRWLTRVLHVVRLLGYSRNAVELSIWLALVVHLLLVLAAQAVGLRRRSPALLARMRWVLAQVGTAEGADAVPTARQFPLPGFPSPALVPT